MAKNSGQPNRNIGLNHQNGKGDCNRVTDVQAYRENFDAINWGRQPSPIVYKRIERSKTLREIEDEEHAWRMLL